MMKDNCMRNFYCQSIAIKSVCALNHGCEFEHKMNEQSLFHINIIESRGGGLLDLE